MLGSSPQPMPTDSVSAFMLAGLWPDPVAIESMSAFAESYRAAYAARLARLDELEQAASTIRATMVSDDFESMHERMYQIVQDQGSVVDNAAVLSKWADMFADECCCAQLSLVSGIEPFREAVVECFKKDDFQGANLALHEGRAKAESIVADHIETAKSWGNLAKSEMQIVNAWTPTGSTATAPSDSHDTSIKPTDYTIGGDKSKSPKEGGRFGGETDQKPQEDKSPADEISDEKDHTQQGERRGGHRSGLADQPEDGSTSTVPTQPGRLSAAAAQTGQPGINSPTPVPSSPSLGASSGGGLPSSGGGLPAAGGGLSSSGLGGVKAPSAEGVGVGSQSGLGSAGSGLGSSAGGAGSAASVSRAGGLGSGGGAGSGGDVGGGRVGGGVASPLSGVPPVSSVSPVGGRADAVGAAGGGGFMPPAGAAPVQHSPAAGGSAVVGGGLPAAGSVMGAAPAAPPPAASAVGAAPTPSPGLSQGSLGPGGAPAAAAAGGGAAAAGLGVVPSAFSGDAPEKIDLYGQMAADAVRKLAPAMAIVPGMLVAAAVVLETRGTPQVVITTNDGAGFLPAGCFLPPNMIHAFADLDSKAFDEKWFGWVDPARTLLDYAYERAQLLGSDVQLLGLATTGRLSAEVKSAFKQAIPLVAPEASAKPVEENRGRNAHRFKVLAPDFYDALVKAPKDVRDKAVVQAATLAMATPAAAPLRVVGAPWHTMSQVGRPLTDSEWGEFRERYDNEIRMCGATRPGFTEGPNAASTYRERFALVRAMEVLMCWRTAPNVSAPDVVYSAHQAGADVNGILSPPSQGSRR